MLAPNGAAFDLVADESLDEPARKRPARSRPARNNVPIRLERVVDELDMIIAEDSTPTVDRLSGLTLAQMTGQIREIEQTALQLAREEGREEFRVKALLHNLAGNGPLATLSTTHSAFELAQIL